MKAKARAGCTGPKDPNPITPGHEGLGLPVPDARPVTGWKTGESGHMEML